VVGFEEWEYVVNTSILLPVVFQNWFMSSFENVIAVSLDAF
jgi:hypothetical protein